jgi:hypothetical protein
MKNWEVFILISTVIISFMLFAGGKLETSNAFHGVNSFGTLISMGKTIIIIFAAIFLMLPLFVTLILDVAVSLIIRREFPLTTWIHDNIYLGFFRGWYWDDLAGSNILLACIILFGIALVYTYAMPRRMRKRMKYNFRKPKRIYM